MLPRMYIVLCLLMHNSACEETFSTICPETSKTFALWGVPVPTHQRTCVRNLHRQVRIPVNGSYHNQLHTPEPQPVGRYVPNLHTTYRNRNRHCPKHFNLKRHARYCLGVRKRLHSSDSQQIFLQIWTLSGTVRRQAVCAGKYALQLSIADFDQTGGCGMCLVLQRRQNWVQFNMLQCMSAVGTKIWRGAVNKF